MPSPSANKPPMRISVCVVRSFSRIKQVQGETLAAQQLLFKHIRPDVTITSPPSSTRRGVAGAAGIGFG